MKDLNDTNTDDMFYSGNTDDKGYTFFGKPVGTASSTEKSDEALFPINSEELKLTVTSLCAVIRRQQKEINELKLQSDLIRCHY